MLSNLAQVFGLLDSVKKILERRKQQTDPSQEQVLSTLASEYRPKVPHSSASGASRLIVWCLDILFGCILLRFYCFNHVCVD